MLKKTRAEAKADPDAAEPGKDFAQGLRGSSRQIWLAGLGAFSRAQAEGMKVFEALVEQGQGIEARTRRAAAETATAATGAATQKAKDLQAMAGGTWDKLEQVFENRVARALSKLGVHTQQDVERLAQRVEALSEAVNELIKSGKRTATANFGARRTVAGTLSDSPGGDKVAARKPRKTTRRRTAG